ncbi:unnamed protein product [Amaranthus hypochondriacus]
MADNDDKIILLDCWASMFATRVRIALAEKGITNYESKEEDLVNHNKSPLLLEMNPVHKKIPVLIHNGKPICESLIIVEYIDEVWNGHTRFMSSDPYYNSQSRFWADFVDKMIYPPSKRIWQAKESTERETAKKEFIENLKKMEQYLGDKCYFGGDNFGLVDIALIPFYSWFHTYETFGNFSIEDECPNIIAWAKRCAQREAVHKSLPDMHKLYEQVVFYKKHILGIH